MYRYLIPIVLFSVYAWAKPKYNPIREYQQTRKIHIWEASDLRAADLKKVLRGKVYDNCWNDKDSAFIFCEIITNRKGE